MTRENTIRRQLLNDFSTFARRINKEPHPFHSRDKGNTIRRQLLNDFSKYARRSNGEPHPFHVKSDWDPPVQPPVALETFPEEVKFELANIKSNKPKDRKTTCHRESEMLSKNYRVTRTLYQTKQIRVLQSAQRVSTQNEDRRP